jgi:ATP-dependent Clp protease ATP-binding subunit ClpB
MENLKKIVDIQIEYLKKRLAERKIEVELSDGAKGALAETGYDPVYGARPLKRTIQRMIENPLATEILKGNFKEGDTIVVDVDKNKEFTFTRGQRKKAVV